MNDYQLKVELARAKIDKAREAHGMKHYGVFKEKNTLLWLTGSIIACFGLV